MLKAPVRFTPITLAKSSSFMRASSVSRVMPALLTSAQTDPKSARTALTVALASSALATSQR